MMLSITLLSLLLCSEPCDILPQPDISQSCCDSKALQAEPFELVVSHETINGTSEALQFSLCNNTQNDIYIKGSRVPWVYLNPNHLVFMKDGIIVSPHIMVFLAAPRLLPILKLAPQECIKGSWTFFLEEEGHYIVTGLVNFYYSMKPYPSDFKRITLGTGVFTIDIGEEPIFSRASDLTENEGE